MLTKSLFKHFLSFSLFAVLLLPQISGPSSALAKRPTATPTPKAVKHVKKPTTKKSVTKPVIKAVPNLNCLDVGLSHVFSDGVVAVPSPLGQGVSFSAYIGVTNNCATTVTGAIIKAPINLTCPGGSTGENPATIVYDVPGLLATGQTGGENGDATVYCVIYTNGVPTSSVVPTSISVDVIASATDANGISVLSSGKTLNVTW